MRKYIVRVSGIVWDTEIAAAFLDPAELCLRDTITVQVKAIDEWDAIDQAMTEITRMEGWCILDYGDAEVQSSAPIQFTINV